MLAVTKTLLCRYKSKSKSNTLGSNRYQGQRKDNITLLIVVYVRR